MTNGAPAQPADIEMADHQAEVCAHHRIYLNLQRTDLTSRLMAPQRSRKVKQPNLFPKCPQNPRPLRQHQSHKQHLHNHNPQRQYQHQRH